MKEGYTRIEKGTYLGFHPDSDRDTVYITIVTTKGRVVCHCFPINEDYSVIVNSNGYIRETKYWYIWVEKILSCKDQSRSINQACSICLKKGVPLYLKTKRPNYPFLKKYEYNYFSYSIPAF